MKRILILVLGSFLLAFCVSCKGKGDPDEWQHKIKQAAELSTVQYSVQQIIAQTDESWKFLGNRKILLKYQAIIKAGINMENFDAESAKITYNKESDTKTITVTLPKPEIFSYNIKPDCIEMLYKDVGVFRSDYTNEERDQIVTQGELQLKQDAELNEMILKDARQNAAKFFEMILLQNGFSTVNITFEK